jgi:hypothetical protein
VIEYDEGNLHVVPIDDLAEHKLSLDCECIPAVDEKPAYTGGLLIVHNSYDQRELWEGTRSVRDQ